MKTRLYSFQVSSEFLIHAFVALWNSFIGILNATTANARSPSSHTATTLSPAIHAPTIEGDFFFSTIFSREENMLGFILQRHALIHGRIKYNII